MRTVAICFLFFACVGFSAQASMLSHGASSVELKADASITIRCGEASFTYGGNGFTAREISADQTCIDFHLSSADQPVGVRARLAFSREGDPELKLLPAPDQAFEGPAFRYPGSLEVKKGDEALFPMGEGCAFPVDDPAVTPIPAHVALNSGSWHLAMIGHLRGKAWTVMAVERAFDASVANERREGLLVSQLEWEPERGGKWGYGRTVRFLVGATGGLNQLCARYRTYREGLGPVATLKEKKARVSNVERLIGAANFWIWPDRYEDFMYGKDPNAALKPAADDLLRLAKELKAGECERAIMGIFFAGDCSAAGRIVAETGYLVTKYDNMEDELPGDLVSLIPPARIAANDTIARRAKYWPNDTAVTADGSYARAWALRGTDGVMHDQHRTCPSFAPKYTQAEVPTLAREYGFNAWFFDVMGFTAMECYSRQHPLTRAESVTVRQKAFDILAENNLVSGTEEGVECYLNSFCYEEGKMSPRLHRINYKESGRRKAHQYTAEEHERPFDTFMLNPKYRIPLWELIYHDCSVNYWYWGDSSNCCPELIDRRDLFNALYGQPPLYSFHVSDWPKLKDAVLKSIPRATRVAQATGYARMTAFDYLTPDRLVQRTTFDNGVKVIVNFSDKDVEIEGQRLKSGSITTAGL